MWHVTEFDSFDLTTNYFAYLTDDDNPSMLPSANHKLINRGGQAPALAGVTRDSDQLVMTVEITASNWRAAQQSLLGALSVEDVAQLVVVDHTGAEWHVYAKPIQALRDTDVRARVIRVPLLVPDRIWRKLAAEIVWNVTGSPETQAVTNAGNRTSLPTITFEPKATKTTGFDYRYWVPIVNTQIDRSYVNYPLDLTDGGLDTTTWVANALISNQCNGAVTAGDTSIVIDTPVGGGLPTHGMGYLVNGADKSQIAWTGMTGTTTSGTLTGVTWEIGGTSQFNMPDNTVIKLSYMQADGADLRFHVNGTDQNLWVRSPNAVATKLWANVTVPAAKRLTLLTAISNTGDVSEIELVFTPENFSSMQKMPNTGVVMFDDEAFSYWGLDIIHTTIFVEARAINDTTAASHSPLTVGYLIENDGFLFSGNPYLDARTNDDTVKPMLDLDASDNDTRTYYEFWDRSSLRTGAWKPTVFNLSYPDLRSTRFYTGNHADETADPATEMGMRMMSTFNGRWNFENGKVGWTLYEPAGIYQVTSWSYDKYRLGAVWPDTAALQKSKDGNLFYGVDTVSTPGSSASWGSGSGGVVLMGSDFCFLKVLFGGNITAGNVSGVGYEADLEVNSIVYTTVAPLLPEIRARNTQAYQINGTFTNTTSEDLFQLELTCNLNEEIEIDCEARTLTTLVDGIRRRSAILIPGTQENWMRFLSGVNNLSYEEAGVTNLDITLRWYDMLVV